MIDEELKQQIEKMMSGELYDATDNTLLLNLRDECQDKCFEYNHIKPSSTAERKEHIKAILGSSGDNIQIVQPFFCDYGFNIIVGENFFANTNLVILDEAEVKFGDNVFIGPNCSFYTACHPIDVYRRNIGLEYSLPIKVGNNVWFGGNVVVLPGVTIGDNCVIGAGTVVNRDVEPDSLVVGNPCRVVRKIENQSPKTEN